MEGFALTNLASAYRDARRPADAVGLLHEALELRRELGDRWGEAQTLRGLGDVQHQLGQRDAAREPWHRALAIFASLDDPQAAEVQTSIAALGA